MVKKRESWATVISEDSEGGIATMIGEEEELVENFSEVVEDKNKAKVSFLVMPTQAVGVDAETSSTGPNYSNRSNRMITGAGNQTSYASNLIKKGFTIERSASRRVENRSRSRSVGRK